MINLFILLPQFVKKCQHKFYANKERIEWSITYMFFLINSLILVKVDISNLVNGNNHFVIVISNM